MTVTHTLTHVFGGIHTAIFSLLREEFNLSLQQLGIIAAIPPLCQALFTIPSGMLSDRVGSKKMLLTSFSVAILGALLASISNNPLVFIIAISLVYVNNTIYHPASYSYTANAFEPMDRPKALGLHGAGGTLGHAIGPLSVSILIGMLAFSWRQVYLILTIPIFFGILMVLNMKERQSFEEVAREEQARDNNGSVNSFFKVSLVMFLLFRTLTSMGGSMISSFIVLYLQDVRGLDLALASFIASARMLSGLVAAPIGGFLAFRFGEKRWLMFASIISYLSFGFSLLSKNVVLFVILYFLYGFCGTLAMASRTSIMARLSPGKQRGLGYSLFFLPSSLIGAVAPALAGLVAELFGFNTVFYIALGSYVFSLVILKFLVKVD
jgi:MFS family permease